MGIQHKITEYFEFNPSDIIKTTDFIEKLRKIIGFGLNDKTDKKKIEEAYKKTKDAKKQNEIKKIIGGSKKNKSPKAVKTLSKPKKEVKFKDIEKKREISRLYYQNRKNDLVWAARRREITQKNKLKNQNRIYKCDKCNISIKYNCRYSHLRSRSHYNNLDPNSEEAKKLDREMEIKNEKALNKYYKKKQILN